MKSFKELVENLEQSTEMKFRVYKTTKRVYNTRNLARPNRSGSTSTVSSRKETDWVMKADDGTRIDGYDHKKDAIAAGESRGWIYIKT